VWCEDSFRGDLERLARAVSSVPHDGFHRMFRLMLSAVPPPRRPSWDSMATQRIAILQR